MKIKSIHLKDFKRFTDLKIEEIPKTAKLVVMIGPNGCGKSSVFDALNAHVDYLRLSNDIDYHDKYYRDLDYFTKSNEPHYHLSYYRSEHQDQSQKMESYAWDAHNSYPPNRTKYETNIKLHGEREPLEHSMSSYEIDKLYRVRTAYRHSSITLPYTINRVDPKSEWRYPTLIENDEVFASNYWRLALQWLERSSESGGNTENLVDLQNEVFGELRDAIGRLFNDPPLVLKNLGNPLDGDLFQFDKGTSERFTFQNLASGEKAALDLLLDVIITKQEWDETIICIDEPEAHIHTKLQGQLLEELYHLISKKSQLWIATHSIGMVRKAQDLWQNDSDSVVFLDFNKDENGEDHNFDEQAIIKPAKHNPDFWRQTYEVALGDLAELVITARTVFCEGTEFDERCYRKIFGSHHPDIRFISLEGKENIEKSLKALNRVIGTIAKSAKIIGLLDRDDAINNEISENTEVGIRTLSRRNIEGYLLDDEVLTELCKREGKPDKIQDLLDAKQEALQKSISEGKDHDDLKPTAQKIHAAAKKALRPTLMGNKSKRFMRDILAPLIQPGMTVYEELHKDIFGE